METLESNHETMPNQKVQELFDAGAEIEKSDFDHFVKYLEEVNAAVRGKTLWDMDTGIYHSTPNERMGTGGDFVAPSNDVQLAALEKYHEALQKIENPENKAQLSYYYLLDLHLFEDGNGRTSRFMYQLFSGKELDSDFILHDKRDHAEKGENNFNETHGLEDITDINGEIVNDIFTDLRQEKVINLPENVNAVTTSGLEYVRIPGAVEGQLSEEEISDFKYEASDSVGAHTNITLGGISMATFLTEKGSIEESLEPGSGKVVDDFLLDGHARFRLNEKALSDWSVEDFRRFNEIGDATHYSLFIKMIERFSE